MARAVSPRVAPDRLRTMAKAAGPRNEERRTRTRFPGRPRSQTVRGPKYLSRACAHRLQLFRRGSYQRRKPASYSKCEQRSLFRFGKPLTLSCIVSTMAAPHSFPYSTAALTRMIRCTHALHLLSTAYVWSLRRFVTVEVRLKWFLLLRNMIVDFIKGNRATCTVHASPRPRPLRAPRYSLRSFAKKPCRL
jgi:hypothetical protein